MERTGKILRMYPDLDGILANDLCASAFLKTAHGLGIGVPERLKILAYDGTFVTDYNFRTLSAIVQDMESIAKNAVEVLLKLINHQPLVKKEIYVPVRYKAGDTL